MQLCLRRRRRRRRRVFPLFFDLQTAQTVCGVFVLIVSPQSRAFFT